MCLDCRLEAHQIELRRSTPIGEQHKDVHNLIGSLSLCIF